MYASRSYCILLLFYFTVIRPVSIAHLSNSVRVDVWLFMSMLLMCFSTLLTDIFCFVAISLFIKPSEINTKTSRCNKQQKE